MKSRTTRRFREAFRALPLGVQDQAKRAYVRFQANPGHPGLRFKRVHTKSNVHSVRVSRDYRALGVVDGDEVVWFWIGSHEDYERLLEQL